jgi:hypothetical protein
MTEQHFDEKEREKQEEKVDEKQEEKYQRDRLNSIIWALILIWGGIVALAANAGLLDDLPVRLGRFPWGDWLIDSNAWGVFFMGAAVILLFEIALRLIMPEYRRPVLGTFILAVVFAALGFGSLELIWPFILIAIGLSIVIGAFTRKR